MVGPVALGYVVDIPEEQIEYVEDIPENTLSMQLKYKQGRTMTSWDLGTGYALTYDTIVVSMSDCSQTVGFLG